MFPNNIKHVFPHWIKWNAVARLFHWAATHVLQHKRIMDTLKHSFTWNYSIRLQQKCWSTRWIYKCTYCGKWSHSLAIFPSSRTPLNGPWTTLRCLPGSSMDSPRWRGTLTGTCWWWGTWTTPVPPPFFSRGCLSSLPIWYSSMRWKSESWGQFILLCWIYAVGTYA